MSKTKTDEYSVRPHESDPSKLPKGRKDKFGRVYLSMAMSEAWKDLTDKQKVLFLSMKMHRFGTRRPERDYKDVPQVQGEDCFYYPLSQGLRDGVYQSAASDKWFYRDIRALENHGFIETISNGREQHKMSIYRFSERWKTWTR